MPSTRRPRCRSAARAAVVGSLLATAFAIALPAAGFEVSPAGPPPEELAPSLRAALAAEGTRAGEGFEVWPVAEPALAESGSGAFGAVFGRLLRGGLVAVLRLAGPWHDYRGQTVAAGTYTLRYALLPQDGYHMGVSPYRDQLLLVPASEDPGAGEVSSDDELVRLARRSSGTNHPAVLALVPAGDVEAPAAAQSDAGQPVLALPVGGLTLGLVVEGTGEI